MQQCDPCIKCGKVKNKRGPSGGRVRLSMAASHTAFFFTNAKAQADVLLLPWFGCFSVLQGDCYAAM